MATDLRMSIDCTPLTMPAVAGPARCLWEAGATLGEGVVASQITEYNPDKSWRKVQ